MTFLEAMDFLNETKKYGSVLGLGSITGLMEELGNVQDTLPLIHVAGTNGKGSTGAFLSAIYRQAGYHVCRFSTPDVFCYEEEFLYDDSPIEKQELAYVFSQVKEACERLVLKGISHPTRFEVETAAAFLYFSMKKPDLCIVEVGMGGETDATNVIREPLVSVFASISMDHTAFLGRTVEEIAKVKAGIIKRGCPAVSTWQSAEVSAVLSERAGMLDASICFSDREQLSADHMDSLSGSRISYRKREDLILSLSGSFQPQNAALALDVVDCLMDRYPVSDEAVSAGLSMTRWPGRFQLLGTEPDFYMDGAHNVDAARMLKETVQTYLSDQPVVYIMGVLEDKDYEQIAEIMFEEGDIVYCVTPDNPRALEARELCDLLLDMDIRAYEAGTVEQAVLCAHEFAGLTGRTVVAFGSLSYLKEVADAYDKTKIEV